MRPSPALSLALAALLSAGACTSRNAVHSAVSTPPPPPPRPRLVVSIVLDQVGSWVLQRHLPLLHDDGAIKPIIARGSWVHDVVYPYAGTYTGPGHAAIYTGAPPADSGIVANRRWDRARARMISMLDDGTHTQFDPEGHTYVAPTPLRAQTVADALRVATHNSPDAHIVSLSMKDRGAVIPGGQHPDMVLWYTEEARGFTTSTYYTDVTVCDGAVNTREHCSSPGAVLNTRQLPAWIAQWNTAHPITERFSPPWTPVDPAEFTTIGCRDDQPGEGNWKGLGNVFPHDLSRASEPLSAVLATPMGAEYLLDAARAAVTQYHMGEDDTPDLLMISISGTDYVGHVFGPESCEAADNLVRIDLALGRFLRELEAHTSVSVLITADHGVMPLVERSHDGGHEGVRVQFDDVVGGAERAVDAALGPGDWVAAYVQPFVFLTPHALEPANRERAIAAAREGVSHVAGVGAVHLCSEAVGWRNDSDPMRRAVALSIDPAVAGELFVVPAEYSVVDERMPQGSGTSHGSPYAQDTHVPVLVAGAGVAHTDTREPTGFEHTAATLAALLGIAPPEHARVDPLPGVRHPTGSP